MRSYERNGVTVDQCTECRGIFLDRGELERLTEAENAFHSPPPRQNEERHDHDDHHSGGRPYKKRKKHFLEELFD
jgi:Zn-finger nucleic acid-binding protein